MGGVVIDRDCLCAVPGLLVAGEDAGGVHGANRLGGNGVANSTVFGGIAGDAIARWLRARPTHPAPPDAAAVDAARARHAAPLERAPSGTLETLRESLHATMWDDVGILRTAAGLARAARSLDAIDGELDATGVGGGSRAFHMAWHDWLNLRSLVHVSKAIVRAAIAREDSRGAHFREDHPQSGALAASTYTVVRQRADALETTHAPVRFTRMAPPPAA